MSLYCQVKEVFNIALPLNKKAAVDEIVYMLLDLYHVHL